MTAIKVAILFVLVAAVHARSPGHQAYRRSISSRIVNGHDTPIEKVPWQVSLIVNFSGRYQHYCGGSIISENWVLTNAHCDNFPIDHYHIQAGSNVVHSGGSVHELTSFISHENYHFDSNWIPHNDIALIRVATPFTFDTTRASIPMFNTGEEIAAGALAIVSGWGALGNGLGLSDILQSVILPVISKAECDAHHQSVGGVSEKEICVAVTSNGQGPCNGDSGGPLAVNGRLAGVVSWVLSCGETPGVFMKVAHYREWIAQHSGL